MPQREKKHLDELSKSLEKIENHNITNIVSTGDFNCPDIRWDTQTACIPVDIVVWWKDFARFYTIFGGVYSWFVTF
jgi:hypothetical protein